MRITLPLPLPLNQVYKMGQKRMYKSQEAKDWEERAGYILKHRKPLEGPVFVGIDLFLKRDRDIDSSQKLLLDLLQKQGVYINDKQIEHLVVRKFKAKEFEKEPCCEIEVVNLAI